MSVGVRSIELPSLGPQLATGPRHLTWLFFLLFFLVWDALDEGRLCFLVVSNLFMHPKNQFYLPLKPFSKCLAVIVRRKQTPTDRSCTMRLSVSIQTQAANWALPGLLNRPDRNHPKLLNQKVLEELAFHLSFGSKHRRKLAKIEVWPFDWYLVWQKERRLSGLKPCGSSPKTAVSKQAQILDRFILFLLLFSSFCLSF